MNAERLLALYERVAEAPDAITRLRRFILDLAVRGKLVPQDPNDETASELLKRIAKEKARLVKVGEIKKSEDVAKLTAAVHHFSIPPGWAITNLQSVCNSVTDGDHLPPPKAEAGVPFLVIGNVRSQSIEFDGSRFVPQTYYEALDPIRRPRSGDLLYTLVGSYGIPVIVRDDQPFCVQRHIGILRPCALMDVNFLARTMESRFVFDQATICATGIAQKTVPLSGLRKLLLPLPPLAEQHRIVAKVDELMALCDSLEAARKDREAKRDRLSAASLARLNTPDPETFTADARFTLEALPALTTRPNQIKQLRQTILNLAVRGKLVPQDPNDEPASELLKRIAKEKARLVKAGEIKRTKELEPLSDSENLVGLPSGWEATRLGNAYDVRDGTHDTPKYVDAGFPLITSKNLSSGYLSFANFKMISERDHQQISERSRVDRGDVLLAMIGSIGNPVIVDTDRPFSIKNVALFKHYERDLSSCGFLRYFLQNAANQMKDLAAGGLQPFVSLGFLRSYPIALPPLAEQHRIVTKVDELMALCDRLEASLTTSDQTRTRLLEATLKEALAPASLSDMEAVECQS